MRRHIVEAVQSDAKIEHNEVEYRKREIVEIQLHAKVNKRHCSQLVYDDDTK